MIFSEVLQICWFYFYPVLPHKNKYMHQRSYYKESVIEQTRSIPLKHKSDWYEVFPKGKIEIFSSDAQMILPIKYIGLMKYSVSNIKCQMQILRLGPAH